MGLKFVGKGSVVVDCRAAWRKGIQWTLVNNTTMKRMYCMDGLDAVKKLRAACALVQACLDEAGEPGKDGEQEKDDGHSVRVCYVSVDDAPAFLNLLDASEHVSEWRAEKNDMLSYGEHGIVRIEYTADRQLLFQEGSKVVFRDEGHEAEKEDK